MEKDRDGEVKIEGLGYVRSNYWWNKVTGDLLKEYSTAGDTRPNLVPIWPLPPLATGSLELKAEKQSAHSNWICSVAFNHDGTKIVSGSDDRTIKVWDAGVNADTHPNLVPI